MTYQESLEPKWVKISTVAAICGTSSQAVHGWIKKGLLKQVGTGSKLRFVTTESFKTFMEKHG